MSAQQPAEPTTERQARDAGVCDDPTGRGEPEALSLMVELPPEEPRLRPRRPTARVHPYSFHRRKIDHDPVTTDGRTGDVVAAASHRDDEFALAGDANRAGKAGTAGAAAA